MKYLLILVPILLNAQTYMAKVEPFDSFTIDAQTSGQIVVLDKKDEKTVVDKVLIKLDDTIDKTSLSLYKQQLKYQKDKLRISTDNYNKFIKIRGKSQSAKDDKFISLLDIKNTIAGLKMSIAQLEDTIKKKSVFVKNLYVNSFSVNKGDYVTQGTKLATAYDISHSKLIVYVNKQDYKNLKDKTILINGKSDKASFYKIGLLPDDTYVSAYKVELNYKGKDFGNIVKVEFKK